MIPKTATKTNQPEEVVRNLLVLVAVFLAALPILSCQASPEVSPTAAVGTTEAPPPDTDAGPTAAPTEAAGAVPQASAPDPDAILERFATVPGIVDPANHGWPREVEGLNGRVTVPAKPQRIINASVGHDEITFALVPASRVVGVGTSTQDPAYSNVAHLAAGLPLITQDPETIVALGPDVIVTSPFFPADGVDALERLGIPVVQTELSNDPASRIDDILFIGYVYGEEDRAVALADEVNARYERLLAVIEGVQGPKPRVIALTRYSDTIWTAGTQSTEGGIIEAAGAVNVAAEAGIDSNQPTSLEGVIAMQPEIVILPQPAEFGAEQFRQDLLADPALADLPAVRSGKVYTVEGRYFTTLSFWNLIGVERLGRLLWPEAFVGQDFGPFTTPEATP